MDQAKNIISHESGTIKLKNKITEALNLRFKMCKIKSLYGDILKAKSTKKTMLQSLQEYENTKTRLEIELEKKRKYCSKCGADKKHWNLGKLK